MLKNLSIFLFSTIILFSCANKAELEKQKNESIPPKIELISESGFPKNWIGKWAGELKIDNNEKDTVFQIPMELNISPSEKNGTWNWQLVYNGSPRDYEMVAFETEKGHFKMDELNTIVLDQQLFDNTFISRYEVAGNLILVTNKLIGEQLLFEVIFSRRDSVNVTGGSATNIPNVNSYPITVYQRAVLEKQ